MSLEINTEDFWKEIDKRVVEHRIEKKLMSEEITKLREQVAAQAAEIEKLRYSLLDVCTEVEYADMLLSHGDTEGALVGVRRAHVAASLGFSLLMRTNDSTQVLAEVRRAERERVAQYVQQGTGDWMLGKKIAAAIRAME